MTLESGLDLLSGYARGRDEAAFGDLVSRYLNAVYSVVLRRLGGDTALAAEVAQSVFADLARKALENPMNLNRFHPLGGWLHRHACFLSAKAVRAEVRRKAREATAPPLGPIGSADVWTAMTPWVDEAVEKLPAGNREALILRFYEQLDFHSIGAELGITDDTAQKRVSRALEQLRGLLEARGVTSTASAIGTALGGHAVAVAPQGISALIASIGHTALITSVPAGPPAALLAASLKAQLAGVALLVAAGGAWIWHQGRELGRLRAELVRVAADRDQAMADSIGFSNAVTASKATQEADRAERLQLRGALAEMRRAATENHESTQSPSPTISAHSEPAPSDADAIVTRVYFDAKSQRQSDPIRVPAKRLDITKTPAELKDAGTQSPVAAAESILWATLHDAGAFSALVADQSSMLGPGDKFGETEKIRVSFLNNLTHCTEVRFVLRTQETEPIPGETISLALAQADRQEPVMLSLKFTPVEDRWMLEQSGAANGR